MSVNPFLLTEHELQQWYAADQEKRNNIHSLLSHLKYIPSLWKKDHQSYYIVSKSAKKPESLQITLFTNNMPIFDRVRNINDISDIVEELHLSEATIQTINYIN
ncbi:hypothetical protein [Robertmurraya siralis]|uniref:hypothetical protein n=1 Tax=Robertmurraya siralis TaxID=77777 RepID=UPI0010F7C4E3|nr:hypothetical protein [Robertmurraya siralis]